MVVRSTASRTAAVSSFEVELASGVKIRVTAGFDATELVRLVETLARGAMLTLPPSVRLHVALRPIDMRAQFDGLAGFSAGENLTHPALAG